MHGLGFAGALKEIGLPQNHLLVALLTFNVGVELGQLLVVAVAYVVYRGVVRWPHIGERAHAGAVRDRQRRRVLVDRPHREHRRRIGRRARCPSRGTARASW